MPKFHCANCNQHIDAPDQMAGTSASCPTCGAPITVPNIDGLEINETVIEHPSKPEEESNRKPIKNANLSYFLKNSAYAFGFIFAGSLIRRLSGADVNPYFDFSSTPVVVVAIFKFIGAAILLIPLALIVAFIASYDWMKRFWLPSDTVYPKLVTFIAIFFYFLLMLFVLIANFRLAFSYSSLIPVAIALILSFIASYSCKKRFWLSAVKIYPKFLVGSAVIFLVFDLVR